MAMHQPTPEDPEAPERADTTMPQKRGAVRVVAIVIAVVVALALIVSFTWA